MNISRKHPNGKRHAIKFSPEGLAIALGFPEGSRVTAIKQFHDDYLLNETWAVCAELPKGVEPPTTEEMKARNEAWRDMGRTRLAPEWDKYHADWWKARLSDDAPPTPPDEQPVGLGVVINDPNGGRK